MEVRGLTEITDDAFMRQARAGDHRAFEALIRRYQALIFNFACRYLGDYDRGCDVTQRVFLQLYLAMPTPQVGQPLKAWLLRVARNQCVDELRSRRVVYFSQLESENDDDGLLQINMMPDALPLPEEVAEYHELQHILQDAIRTLPPRFRSIVLLRYLGQRSFAEIGRQLNMRECTVKSYFYRALPLLRAALIAYM